MFTESDRRIFGPYDDGSGTVRYADPLVVQRRLSLSLQGNPGQFYRDARIEPRYEGVGDDRRPVPPDAGEVLRAEMAAIKIVEAARIAFEFLPWDQLTGNGATESECLQVLGDFLTWKVKKKPTAENSPT